MQLLRTLRVCVLQRHYSDPAFKDRSVGREDTFLTVPLLREYHFNVPVSLRTGEPVCYPQLPCWHGPHSM